MATTMKPSDYTHTIVWHGPSYATALGLTGLLWACHRIRVSLESTPHGSACVLFAEPKPGRGPDLATVKAIVLEILSDTGGVQPWRT